MYIRILIFALLLWSSGLMAQPVQYLATPLRVTENRGYFKSDSGLKAFTVLDTISASYLGAPDKIGDARLKNDTPYVRTSTHWLRLNTGAGSGGPSAYLYPTAPLSATVTIIKDQAATNSAMSWSTLGETITTNALGVTPTTTSGLALENTTAAANNAQQITPGIHLRSFGYGTTAGTSQAVNWDIYGLPVQGTVPTGSLLFQSSVAGSAFSTRLTIASNGDVTATRFLTQTFRDPVSGNNYLAVTGSSPNNVLTWGNTGVLTTAFVSKVTTGVFTFDNPIKMRTTTGTSLLNFPDAGTTAADGIMFGASGSASTLYRSTTNTISTGGAFTIIGSTTMSGGGACPNTFTISTGTGSLVISSNTTSTSGTFNKISVTSGLVTGSGTAEFKALNFSGTINQTGGANGITGGVYINPTLTAAADFRAIETTNTTGKSIVTASAPSTFGGSVQTTLLKLPNTGGAATSGTATLVAGTITVNTTAMTATALLFLQRKISAGTIGFALTYTQVNGTSFTVNSDNILDTSTINWWIVETY